MSNSRASGLPNWYIRTYGGLVVAVFCLIALGGATRIMKAGLACPDWPLCFGDVIPNYHPQVYFEFIHRVVAGSVAIVTVVLQILLWRSRAPRALKWLAGFSVALLLAQIIFGGLTVLLLLKAGVVATHLILGTGFFVTLLWIYLSLKEPEPAAPRAIGPRWLFWSCLSIVAFVYGQILLGGLVASNFASLVCIDWPTCHGQWFPTFSGIIGLHIIHRLGGYFVFTAVWVNLAIVHKFASSQRLKYLSRLMAGAVCVQVVLGVANILLLTPPLIAVLHLATGVLLLSLTMRQLHVVRALATVSQARRAQSSPRVSGLQPRSTPT